MPTAYFSASIGGFLAATPEAVVGTIATNSDFAIDTGQRDAWLQEIESLRSTLAGIDGWIHLEFVVPRIGSRIDAVVIASGMVFVLEFKVGQSEFRTADLTQAWDYALDLKNFHRGSHDSPIMPILVATAAPGSDSVITIPHADGVFPPLRSNVHGLRGLILAGLTAAHGPALNGMQWALAPYRPTPTIIEAAQKLFAGHSVDEIARHEAGIYNLHETAQSVEQVIRQAREDGQKAIVFVTGVPGAGKTLVGLDVATKRRDEPESAHAVFLSGNAPLVAVLRAALTRDATSRHALRKDRVRKGDIAQEVKAFIQNVHHFRDAGLNDAGPPSDHVVIFDEAQRAWNRAKTADFMRRKKGRPEFDESEPEFLLSCLDRHSDWAVVICLVGGGQEIHNGEAGIAAWLEAARDRFSEWRIYISPTLVDSEYAAGHAIESLASRPDVIQNPSLHLGVSARSFRSEHVSQFVKAVLDHDVGTAQTVLEPILQRYPLALTRNLAAAKRWVRSKARGSERYGVVVSSGAQRLKPHAIDVRVQVDPVHWFLDDPDDTRSSYYLEDAATEFQVQGLELDWTCVVWDADLRHADAGWRYHSFRGSRWENVRTPERQQYLRNAYRVLLTRARQGMVICVPAGERTDPTRSPAFYDDTFGYLSELGIPVL